MRRVGIRVGHFIQFGYRGETRADIALTLKMVHDCLPAEIGVSVSYPLPGTKFYERVKEELGDKQNWRDSGDLAMMYHGTYSTKFYRVLYRVIHANFGGWRVRAELKRVLFHPTRWRPRHLRQLAALPLYALRRWRAQSELNALEQRETPAPELIAAH